MIRRTILGIDPGLAHTGWGIVEQRGPRLACTAYGCITTTTNTALTKRLLKINEQIEAVIERYCPTCVGIETIWFGQNISAAFGTGQARGAALVACAKSVLDGGGCTPRQITLAVVGSGGADKLQVSYMVQKLLNLEKEPKPDHASDALAAAICYTTHDGLANPDGHLAELIAQAERKAV
ncbi:MAG: crossover junction endodeoxyribonuclease RuvC [Eggerthellaceae bacterium]|nr:crossover junction endodeoxyribonuclease RuvC [Eggerthellaceae bacterium]